MTKARLPRGLRSVENAQAAKPRLRDAVDIIVGFLALPRLWWT